LQGLLALQRGARLEAVTALRRAVERDPELREAWVLLTRQERADASVTYSPSAWRAASYPELATVATAWRHVKNRDWQPLADLDASLGQISPSDPLYRDALRLRARWRIEQSRPELGREAVELLDSLLPLSHSLADAIQRNRALSAAGEAGPALQMLSAILRGLDVSKPGSQVLLENLEQALSEVPAGNSHTDERARLADALAARRLDLQSAAPLQR
jgi:tetratricopeptide (TPR) repeat protein